MSSLKDFLHKPTEQKLYKKEYLNSVFSLPASPQYSNSEVCLSSLLRALGSEVSEKEVYSINSLEGSDVRTLLSKKNESFKVEKNFNDDILNYLKSPFAGQSPKNPSDYLNLYPLIPQFSFVSNSAQFTGNPWNPSEFIKGMIATGSSSFEMAQEIWDKLYENLGVNDDDDLWSRVLYEVFSLDDEDFDKFKWNKTQFDINSFNKYCLDFSIYKQYEFPAKTFCNNLDKIISLKKVTTRRQWISMVESFLRICMCAHLVWLCNLNIQLWTFLWNGLNKCQELDYKDVIEKLFGNFKSIDLDADTGPTLRRIAGDYGVARIGINLLLHYFNEVKDINIKYSLSNFSETIKYCNQIIFKSTDKDKGKLKQDLLGVLGQNPNIQQGKSSFAKNIFEFLRHCLGQKATNDSKERNFDQGYWAVKKGKHRNSTWMFKLGPVSIITVVALSIKDRSGTAADITAFLQELGILLNPDKLLDYSLGESLLDLGLTNDNPDGEKGIIILNPFYQD